MPTLDLLNIEGNKIKSVKLNKAIWEIKPNDLVLHDALISARASLRQGTHKTKTRGEVSGGGRKPWRQKGLGRARHGSIRSPIWRGGGVVFGPRPRSYKLKMNKKEYRLALLSALAYKYLNKELLIVDHLVVDQPKTKSMIQIINNLKADKGALMVVKELSDNLILASRNIEKIKVITADEINPYDISSYHYLIVTEEALKMLEERLMNNE